MIIVIVLIFMFVILHHRSTVATMLHFKIDISEQRKDIIEYI